MSKKKTFGSKFINDDNDLQFDRVLNPAKHKLIKEPMLIPYDQIIRNPKNRVVSRDTSLKELASSIKFFGLMDYPLVKKVEDDQYMLIAGERRWTAIGYLREKDPSFMKEGIPCLVMENSDDPLLDEGRMYASNWEREDYTPEETRLIITRMSALYEELIKKGARIPEALLKGVDPERVKAKHLVANQMDISVRQVEKLISINDYLLPELVKLFDEQKLSINNANIISHLSIDNQKKLYELYLKEGKITDDAIKAAKKIDDEEIANIKGIKDKNKELQDIINRMKSGNISPDQAMTQYNEARREMQGIRSRSQNRPTYALEDNIKEVKFSTAVDNLEKAQRSIKVLVNDVGITSINRLRIQSVIDQLNDILEDIK